MPIEISAPELRQRLANGDNLILIDVREPFEQALASIGNSELIPMGSVPAALQRLEARADSGVLVVYCHHGVRSLNVVSWLRSQGLDGCQSLQGGIEAWSLQVDPAVPRY